MADHINVGVLKELEELVTKMNELEGTDPYLADAKSFAQQAQVSLSKHVSVCIPDADLPEARPTKKAKSE